MIILRVGQRIISRHRTNKWTSRNNISSSLKKKCRVSETQSSCTWSTPKCSEDLSRVSHR